MFRFKVSIPDMEKAKGDAVLKAKKVLMLSMMKMEELAIKNAAFDKGELREKISLFPEVLNDKYVLTSHSGHSADMEYGTRPFFAPIKPLKEWAGRKLGDPALGYAVRASIAKHGIRAHPFMRPSLYEVKDYWYQVYKKQVFSEK